MRAKVNLHVTFETEVPDDPDAYEGAATPDARLAKEKEYLSEGGDYLFQALAVLPHSMTVVVEPVEKGEKA